jgi:peptidoglycan hydrolase CwlO-like protein
MNPKIVNKLQNISVFAMEWLGSVKSLIFHTILFIAAFTLYFFNVELQEILLVLTTLVSLEAIYLAIFIQMGVNLQAKKLQSVEKNVADIQEDVEDIQEDVEGIQEDYEADEDDKVLEKIETTMNLLIKEIRELKKNNADKIKKSS